MSKTPVRRAWTVLSTAFAVSMILAVSLPLTIRWYLVNATVAQEIALAPINGAVQVKEPGVADFIAVLQSRTGIPEGAVIATDEHSQAFLRLFENSTLTLYHDTRVVVERMRSPRYDLSPRANEVRVRIDHGRAVIGVAPPLERALDVDVSTPHTDLALEEGSYSVVVDTETQLTIIRPGAVTVVVEGDERLFRSGRWRIAEDMSVEGPLPPEQNLIVNGDFSSVLERGWQVQAPQRQNENDPFGTVQILLAGEEPHLSFQRRGARTHGENTVIQYIDKDVRDFTSLRLTCEVLVNEQSLQGGGYESTEFPVMIELKFTDTLGNQRWRYWGFYYLDPGTGPEWRTMVNGIKLIQGEWYLFEGSNLMQSMGDAPPVHIESMRVYASGWDWDSAITNISLLIQE
jgi:hypothetical protein